MKKSRAFVLLMVVALVVALTSACSKNNNDPAPSNNASTNGEDVSNAEPLKFSVTVSSGGVDNTQSMIHKEWMKLMEEKMGRKIEIDWNYIPSADYDAKVKLEIASNNLTDFFMTPLFYDTSEMAEQGQILDISQYKDLMPNYMDYLGQVKDGVARTSTA
ncbi:MAG: extracellular solute-binding protein family 1, partial [Paenibacillus sp.]|nr:extracellular solute-binding protein family 1 [Paenibacillus sp.]